MPQLTDEQLVEALEENGHRDIAAELAKKLRDEQDDEPPRTMNDRIRGATGR